MRMVRSFIRRRPGKSFTESKCRVRNQCGTYFISEVGRLDPCDLVRTVLCFRGVDSELVTDRALIREDINCCMWQSWGPKMSPRQDAMISCIQGNPWVLTFWRE